MAKHVNGYLQAMDRDDGVMRETLTEEYLIIEAYVGNVFEFSSNGNSRKQLCDALDHLLHLSVNENRT